MMVNVALTIGLGLALAQTGIALALTSAGWVNALSLAVVLQRRGQFALDARSRRSLPRILLAALGMGVVLAVLQYALGGALAAPLAVQLGALTVLVGGGLLGFAVLAVLFGAVEWRDLKRRLHL
jgi:putative peptidoglycan lipid II flippase